MRSIGRTVLSCLFRFAFPPHVLAEAAFQSDRFILHADWCGAANKGSGHAPVSRVPPINPSLKVVTSFGIDPFGLIQFVGVEVK